jgi:tetratricopeptide (TPR) repeat protein
LNSCCGKNRPNTLLLADTTEAALATGAFERAQQLIDAGLQVPGDTRAWRFRQSGLYIAERRLDEARQVLLVLEQEGGKHPAIAHNLAYVELLKGSFQSCVEIIEPWIGAGAASGDDSSLQVLWLRALHRPDRTEEAWQWVKQRLAAASLSPAAAGVASLIAVDLGNLDAALGLSQQALDGRPPKHIETWQGLGWTCVLQRDLPSAATAFEVALRLDPDYGESHGALAVVQALHGQAESARELVDRATELDSSNLAARYAQAVLSGEAHDFQDLERLTQRLPGKSRTRAR